VAGRGSNTECKELALKATIFLLGRGPDGSPWGSVESTQAKKSKGPRPCAAVPA